MRFARLCNYYVAFIIACFFGFILMKLFIAAYTDSGLWGIAFILFVFSIPIALIIGSVDRE